MSLMFPLFYGINNLNPIQKMNLRTYTSVIQTETIFEKHVVNVLCVFSLVHVPSANMEETGFMTYTAANHQVAINTLASLLGNCHVLNPDSFDSEEKERMIGSVNVIKMNRSVLWVIGVVNTNKKTPVPCISRSFYRLYSHTLLLCCCVDLLVCLFSSFQTVRAQVRLQQRQGHAVHCKFASGKMTLLFHFVKNCG